MSQSTRAINRASLGLCSVTMLFCTSGGIKVSVFENGLTATPQECVSAGPMANDSIMSEGHAATADLDCDGAAELLGIRWVTTEGIAQVEFSVRGVDLDVSLLLDRESLPRIVQIADLNGDGIRDMVIADVSIDGISSGVVLVKKDSLISVRHVSRSVAAQSIFVINETLWSDDCLAHVLPRAEGVDGVRLGISIAVGEQTSAESCRNPLRRLFHIVDHQFVAIDLPLR